MQAWVLIEIQDKGS